MTDTLVGMRLFDLKLLATAALVLSACSDDGLVGADTEAGETASAGSSGGSATAASTGGAVTTADPTADTSDPSDSGTTDPTGPTDTDGPSSSTGDDGTSGSSGGDSSGGSSTGGSTEPECTMDEDCMLVDDCCSCDAIPVGEDPAKCEIMECLIPTCQSLGLGMPAVQCNFGTCEVEEVNCNPFTVTCDPKDNPPPKCPEGQAPRVVDECWGNCVPVEYCDVVPSCDDCGQDEVCIEAVTQLGPSFTCEPIPPSCEGAPSCDCMGEEVCIVPFDVCNDGIEPKSGSEISCSCPTC